MDRPPEVRTSKRLLQGHALFVGAWAVLLVLLGLFPRAGELPWLGWALGLAPALGGISVFVAAQGKGLLPWAALVAGETLGVILGGALIAGPGSPVMIVTLWPVVWAALALPPSPGWWMLGGTATTYLAVGLWRMLRSGPDSMTALAIGLYLVAFCGAFLLLRSLEAAGGAGGTGFLAARPADTPPRPETLGAPAPADDALHQDLRVARDIQVSLLLASSPRLPGWEASTSFLPARELGGDLYDFVELDPSHWGIMIGDVSGKGIPAALHMAVARTLFRVEARNNRSPADALTQINQSLMEQAPQGCVTLLYAHLNVSDGKLRMANAGHNYPLVLDETAHEIALDGLPLGIDRDYTFTETTAQLMPGDVLVFYTDGVVEAFNEQDELFGFEQLQRLLSETKARRPRTLTRQIVRAVRTFTGSVPQSDDITLVILRRRYEDRVRELTEVALDVLGPEGGEAIHEQLQRMQLAPDAPAASWRAAVLTLGGFVRDRWGQGPSRELMQQLFLTLESF